MDRNHTGGSLGPIGRRYSTRSGSWSNISHSLVACSTHPPLIARFHTEIGAMSHPNGASDDQYHRLPPKHITGDDSDLICTTTGALWLLKAPLTVENSAFSPLWKKLKKKTVRKYWVLVIQMTYKARNPLSHIPRPQNNPENLIFLELTSGRNRP